MRDLFPHPFPQREAHVSYLLKTITQSKIAEFWSKVDSSDRESCWPWLGATDSDGYGVFYARGHRTASRVALALTDGVEPSDKHALHSCDNPPCCNPSHLRWGDPADNAQDKVSRGRARGRYSIPAGEGAGS